MDLPTYTNIWRIEKRLYKLYDLRLPMPLPLVQIGVFLGVFVPWILMLRLVGIPFESPWHVLYIVPPGVLTWLATRPVIEGKRLTELLLSQGRYLAEPRTWCRLTPIREPREVVIVARVWRRPETVAPAAEHVALKDRRQAVPAPAAAAPAAPAPEVPAPRPEAPPATPRLENAPAAGKRGLVSGVRRPGSSDFATSMAPGDEDRKVADAAASGGEPGDKKVAGKPSTPPPPATRPDIPMVPGTFGVPESLVTEAQPRHPAEPPRALPTSAPPADAPAPDRPAEPGRPEVQASSRGEGAVPEGPVAPPVTERPAASGEPERPEAQTPPQGERPAAASREPARPDTREQQGGPPAPEHGAGAGETGRPVVPPPQWQRPAAASREPGRPEAPTPAPGQGAEPGEPQRARPAGPAEPHRRSAAQQGRPGDGPGRPRQDAPAASASEPAPPNRPAQAPPAPAPRTFGSAPEPPSPPASGHGVPAQGWPTAPDEPEPTPDGPRLEAPRPWSKGLSKPPRPAATDAQMWPPAPEPPAPGPPQDTPPQDTPPQETSGQEEPPRDVRSGPQSPVRPRPLPPPPAPPPSGPAITPPGPEHEVSGGGLRRLFQAVGGGNGDTDAEYQLRLQQPFQGTRHVVVLGCTGGAGQTVTSLMLGHTFAQHNGEPVVAIDVNPGPGALARRTRSETNETLTGLITRADQVGSLTAMRRYTSQAKSGLDVIAAGKNPLQALDDRDYALAIRTIDRFYSVTLLDTAAAVVARVLPYADQLVLVAPASNDAPRAVAMTYEWLDGHGYEDLRSRAVTVINGVSRRSMDDVEQAEAVARGRCRALVRIPWDDHLSMDRAPRNELKTLRAPTRRAYLALAGVVAGGFGVVPERYQELQRQQEQQEQEATR